MRRWLGWIAIGWLLVVCAATLFSYGTASGSSSLSDRTRGVALDLRCPVCQGESVADSQSGIAKAMRSVIRKRLARGEQPSTVKAFLVSRYGNWILLAPPRSGISSVAWLAPPLLLVGGIGLLVTLIVDWRSKGRRQRTVSRSEYVDRVRRDLAAEGLDSE